MSSVPDTNPFLSRLLSWFGIVVVATAAGGAAGYIAAKVVAGGFDSQLAQLWSRLSTQVIQPGSTASSTPQVVSLEAQRRPLYPAAFVNRSVSSLLPLVKLTGMKAGEPTLMTPDQALGYGIALTTDGWLVLPAPVVTSVTDVGFIWNARVYPVTRAVRDRLLDVVFVKIDATNLPIADFASPLDVVPGLGVWAETEPRHFHPETIIANDARVSREAVVSERPLRRFLVSLPAQIARPGVAAWTEEGKLVGIVLGGERDGVWLLPSTGLSGALSQVLAGRSIQHAALGLKIQDVASLVSMGISPNWPSEGTLVRQLIATSTLRAFQEGDVIERLDRDPLDGTVDLGERLLDYRPGASVTFRGTRKGVAFQSDVTLFATTTSEIIK